MFKMKVERNLYNRIASKPAILGCASASFLIKEKRRMFLRAAQLQQTILFKNRSYARALQNLLYNRLAEDFKAVFT